MWCFSHLKREQNISYINNYLQPPNYCQQIDRNASNVETFVIALFIAITLFVAFFVSLKQFA